MKGDWYRLRLPVLFNISGDACVDACGILYLNQYFHSHQIKLYLLNSTLSTIQRQDALMVI